MSSPTQVLVLGGVSPSSDDLRGSAALALETSAGTLRTVKFLFVQRADGRPIPAKHIELLREHAYEQTKVPGQPAGVYANLAEALALLTSLELL